jgi:hypothetical protein
VADCTILGIPLARLVVAGGHQDVPRVRETAGWPVVTEDRSGACQRPLQEHTWSKKGGHS